MSLSKTVCKTRGEKMFHSISMTKVASTLTDAIGVERPKEADEGISMVKELREDCAGGVVDRLLIFSPDAVGAWLFQKYTNDFAPVLKHTQMGLPVSSVMPSVTPVNYGTMFTGALPNVHGIEKYEKKLIKTDTVFDAAIRGGKKVALLALVDSSMSIIFQEREMDYYIFPNDDELNEKALELIKEDKYDVLLVYNMEFDDAIHATGAESEFSVSVLRKKIDAFDKIANAVKEQWKNHDTMICWLTDHGIHQGTDGHGRHGDDIEEDRNVMHFYGVYPKEREE